MCQVTSGNPHMSDEVVEAVQEAMDAAGSLVTVRFVDDAMLFTFDSPMTALKAVQQSPLTVRLETDNCVKKLNGTASAIFTLGLQLSKKINKFTLSINFFNFNRKKAKFSIHT